jgi:hypothetical protein
LALHGVRKLARVEMRHRTHRGLGARVDRSFRDKLLVADLGDQLLEPPGGNICRSTEKNEHRCHARLASHQPAAESTGVSKINTIATHPFGGVTTDAIGEELPLDLSEHYRAISLSPTNNDAAAVAALFTKDGILVKKKTRTPTGFRRSGFINSGNVLLSHNLKMHYHWGCSV